MESLGCAWNGHRRAGQSKSRCFHSKIILLGECLWSVLQVSLTPNISILIPCLVFLEQDALLDNLLNDLKKSRYGSLFYHSIYVPVVLTEKSWTPIPAIAIVKCPSFSLIAESELTSPISVSATAASWKVLVVSSICHTETLCP